MFGCVIPLSHVDRRLELYVMASFISSHSSRYLSFVTAFRIDLKPKSKPVGACLSTSVTLE